MTNSPDGCSAESTEVNDDLCQCPKCGRMHRHLGKPPASISGLPDDIRVPLHELQADVDYMVGRMIEDGNSAPVITETIKAKLTVLETALLSRVPAQAAGMPEIPDDDADFTPNLARKIIAKYQAIIAMRNSDIDELRRAASIPHPGSSAASEPVAYVPRSKAPDSEGEPLWREVFAAKWLSKGTWQGFDLMPLYSVSPQAAPVPIGLKTNPELLALIERAKTYVMSPEEVYEQRRSFTRGMCPSNRDYTEWCDAVDRLLPPLSLSRPHGGGK